MAMANAKAEAGPTFHGSSEWTDGHKMAVPFLGVTEMFSLVKRVSPGNVTRVGVRRGVRWAPYLFSLVNRSRLAHIVTQVTSGGPQGPLYGGARARWTPEAHRPYGGAWVRWATLLTTRFDV